MRINFTVTFKLQLMYRCVLTTVFLHELMEMEMVETDCVMVSLEPVLPWFVC